MKITKEMVCIAAGTVGSFVANLCGGWDGAMKALIIFMAIDYITGFLVAAVFKESPKSETGALESRAGFKGLCRKGVTLLIVVAAHQLDIMTGVDYIRNAVIIGFCANELISIVENGGLMGVPMPSVMRKAIDILTRKAEEE